MNQPVQKNTLYVGKPTISSSSSSKRARARSLVQSPTLLAARATCSTKFLSKNTRGRGSWVVQRTNSPCAWTNPGFLDCLDGAGGLAEEVDEKILHAAFVPFGEVKDVKTPLDQSTQKHRSFGFVTFLEREDAAAAMDNMDGAELFGRVLTVNYAFPERIKGGEQGWAAQPSEPSVSSFSPSSFCFLTWSCPALAASRLIVLVACD
jgi:RNA recognition motif-containing protein